MPLEFWVGGGHLLALIGLVLAFLKHLAKRDKDMTVALNRNSEMLGRVAQALEAREREPIEH